MDKSDVVVIGAGWAGLSAASRLQEAGLRVRVFEKGRGPGGRSATRRQAGFEFDHGAQYFTARAPEFRAAVEGWKARGLVASWSPRLQVFGPRPERTGTSPDERLVGLPGMNGVLSHLAAALSCHYAVRLLDLRFDQGWHLRLDSGEDIHTRSLIVTAPPAQAAELLGPAHPFHDQLLTVPMEPTWALLAGLDRDFDPGFDGAFDNEGPLSWMARNSDKPGRQTASWVAHADLAWSRKHLEQSQDWVAGELWLALSSRLSLPSDPPTFLTAHRWRYAQCSSLLDLGCLWDAGSRLAVAGDWCAGNRVEGAWTSGQKAAERVLDSA